MDDLKKQKIKNIDKVVSKVTDGYQNEMLKKNYYDLKERQGKLLDKVADSSYDVITRESARLQLAEIGKSLHELEQKIDWHLDYDTDCDEDAAKQFMKDNDLMTDEIESMVSQNDALDELEKKLYQGDKK